MDRTSIAFSVVDHQRSLEFDARTIGDIVEEHAVRNPDKVAVRCGSESLTYRALVEMGVSVADYFGNVFCGQKGQKVIGVALRRSVNLIPIILGIWKAGHVYLPLDLKLPEARRIGMLRAAGASVVICETNDQESDAFADAKIITTYVDNLFQDKLSSAYSPATVSLNDLAYVLFTSGSTGDPKGALIEHVGALNNIYNKLADFSISQNSVVLQNASIAFDVSIWQMFIALVSGGTTVIADDAAVNSPRELADIIDSFGVTHAEFVPSYFSIFLEVLTGLGSAPKFDALECLIFTGEPVVSSHIKQFRELFPGISIGNAYGPTEASDDITHFVIAPGEPIPDVIPIGYTLRNFALYICDESLMPVPRGSVGQIFVSGLGVGRGYCNPPEGKKSPFLRSPFPDLYASRLYATGDLGTMADDGCVYFRGREDRQVKLHGNRIELDEIERAIQAIDTVSKSAVVMLHPSHSSPELHACVTSTMKLNLENIKLSIAQTLPRYMVPSRIYQINELPMLSSGKVDYHKVREYVSVTNASPTSIGSCAAAKSRLTGILEEVLGMSPLPLDATFFDLGGDSFRAIRVASKYGPPMNIADIYNSVNVAELISSVESKPAQGEVNLYTHLAGPRTDPLGILVCFPNSGGDPVGFIDFAHAAVEHMDGVAVLGANLPRNPVGSASSSNRELEFFAIELADQFDDLGDIPITIFGQCNGSAPALALAFELEKRGRRDFVIVLSGALMRTSLSETDQRNDAEILDFLLEIGSSLPTDREDIDQFLERFRYDVYAAGSYFDYLIGASGERRLCCKLICVIGESDPLTTNWEARFRDWEIVCDDVELSTVADCGHFATRDKPSEIAEICIRALSSLL